MEALGYFLYFLLACFFVALVLGIAKGTSPKYLIQTLEETEVTLIRFVGMFSIVIWGLYSQYY